MAVVTEWLKIDGEHPLEGLESAITKLSSGASELVLDFSSVRKLDAAALERLNDIAATASEKNVQIVLRGVTIDVYRVLKTAQIAAEFVFLN